MSNDQAETFPRLLNPDSIAVAGASTDTKKRGFIALKRLLNSSYDGELYPVNPSYEGTIMGLQVYPSLSAIGRPVDLVYVVTPAHTVPEILRDAGEANVAGAVIFAAGFSEMGNEELEQQLLDVRRKTGIRFIGPNVMGMVNVPRDLFLGIDAEYEAGSITVISQSGNLGMNLGRITNQHHNTGLSHFVSIGNEADVKFHELIEYFADESSTDILLVYAEGMSEGRQFLQVARQVIPDCPIVVLKGGRTRRGKSSAQLHTASLAGDASVLNQVYRQAGVISVNGFDELVPVAQALTGQPPLSGPNIGVMTEAGGVATIATDALVEQGLNVPELTKETQEALQDLFPYSPNVTNPVDTMVTSNTAALHAEAAERILCDPNIDGLLICGAYGGYGIGGHGIELPTDDESARHQLASSRQIAELPSQLDKPILIKSTLTPEESEALSICREGNVPVYDMFDRPPAAFSALLQYGRSLDNRNKRSDFVLKPGDSSHPVLLQAGRENHEVLTEYEAKLLLSDRGLPVAPFRLATSPDEAVEAANEFDTPVAMKIVSREIPHKTDADGVKLNVQRTEAVRQSFERLKNNAANYDPDATIDGVLISPMLNPGLETIVGVTEDPEVGPVVMFGLGGIFVEVLEDVAFGAIPLTEHDARQMIKNIRGYDLITGTRGNPGVDEEELVDLLLLVSRLRAENPGIEAIDLNPVFCYETSISVVDAAIQLKA